MKKYILILITSILLAYTTAYAINFRSVIGGGAPAVGGSECDSYDTLCENLEGTGYEADACGSAPCYTETTGSPDEDYEALHLRGEQSLKLGTSDAATTFTISGLSTGYIHFELEYEDLPGDWADLFLILDSGNTTLGRLNIGSGGQIRVCSVGDPGSCSGTVATLSEDILYHVWVDYVASTGVITLTVDTDETKAGGSSDNSDGSDTKNDMDKIRFVGEWGAGLVVDQIYVDSSVITSVPTP